MDKMVFFDIETDSKAGTPGIRPTCIGVATSWGLVQAHYERTPGTQPYPRRMTSRMVRGFLDWLAEQARLGATLVGWNSLGFDFKVLACAAESDEHLRLARDLALGHVDPAFALMCHKGYMVGLQACANGMRVDGKMSGMDGLQAIEMWVHGTRADQDKVLDYVKLDAAATLRVVREIEKEGALGWITRKGAYRYWRLPGGEIPDVEMCLLTPEPDVSWMDDPSRWDRANYAGWLEN